MKTMLLSLALIAAAPAFAQQVDHSRMDHSKMGHAMPATAPADQPQVDHSKMDHSRMDHSRMDHSRMDHSKPATAFADQPQVDHSKMDHSKMGHGMPESKSAASEPRTPIPPVTDADRAAATPPPRHMHHLDNAINTYTLFNRLEAWDTDPGTGLGWEAQGWIGTDLDRLWWRSEGERVDGHLESADLEVLYGRSVSTWWDVVAGVRHDFRPGDGQNFVGVGVQGLAPQKFEVSAMAYVGERGQTAARLEVEYETLLTNRLILQPLLEADFYGKNDPARGIGSGLGTMEAGLRLRYEFNRRFAPYIGIVHERAFGRTAEFRRAEGEGPRDTRLVAGIRIWF